MGGGQKQDTSQNLTQSITLPAASSEELALRKAFGALGEQQQRALTDALERSKSGVSPFELAPQDLEQLTQSFDAARTRLVQEGKDYADFLAGGRGLRISDTPVSQQALNRFGLGLADLESQRALARLNYGLEANKYRNQTALGFASALPAGSLLNYNNLFQERLSQPTQRTTGYGNAATTLVPGAPFGASLLGGLGGAAQGIGSLYSAGLLGGGAVPSTAGLGLAGLPGAAGMAAMGSALGGTAAGVGGLSAGLASLPGAAGMSAIAGLGALF